MFENSEHVPTGNPAKTRSPSVPLREIVEALDAELKTADIPDYPGAVNGLQLANPGRVTRVACAVDASLPVVRDAVARGCDLLVVHHGLFWGAPRPITAGAYEKWALAIHNGLAIYSSHLPLDIHPDLGNNIRLARALGLNNPEPFFPWKGIQLGLHGTLELGREELADRLGKVLGGPIHLCPAGPDRARRIGLVTGGAGSEIHQLAATGIDTFITGEGPHWSHTAAQELGINLLLGGHYNTETSGVTALGHWLHQHFNLPFHFLHHPTHL